MKKNILIVIAVVFIGFQSYAQNFINAYTDKTPDCSVGGLSRIATDNMKNVINSNVYSGNIVVGNSTFISNGIISSIIIKKDDNDSVVWAKSLSSGNLVIVGGLYTDQQSNLYVTGYFGDSLNATTLNCDPYPISVSSGIYSFIIKYAPDGTVLWSNSIKIANGTTNSNTDLFRIAGNGTDRIVISSFFYYIPSQTIGVSTISSSSGNLFYAVIDNNGNWQHATVLGGTSMHISLSIAMASNNDVYIAGEFKGDLNLGVAGTLSTLTSSPQDFVCKANATGDFVWAKLLESSSWWRTEVLSQNNDVYLFGTFSGTIHVGTTVLTAANYSTYFAKIDNGGTFLWAKQYGINDAHFYCATKNNNRIYLTGYTSPYVSANQFDTLNLVYANTLPTANTYSCICFLVEADLSGNALTGAAYSFDFATLNTQSMACTDSRVYLTGNVGSIASFGGYVISSLITNASNYVAVFTDSANIIAGKTYYDFNSNNIQDPGDINCPAKLNITKGGTSATAFVNGPYKVCVDKGTYLTTVNESPLYYTYTPNSYTSSFSNFCNQTDSLNDFAFQPIPGQNDLVVDLVLGQLRPGFNGTAYASLKNIGTTIKSGSMSVLLNNPEITITSCVPSAISIVANTATLAYNLNPIEQQIYIIEYTVTASAVIGSSAVSSVSAPDITDLTPSNNVDTIHAIISGSYDPNSKEVFPGGDITPAFISQGDPLEYTIHFQNTGNDTAFTVILTDTISNKLDLSSFQLISSSKPVVVNCYNNEIWFRFYNINLPDSSINEALSHGFVKYSIKPKSTCVVGDFINNKAYIYFDYNMPVVTNTTTTLIENPLNIHSIVSNEDASIYPNPTNGGFATIVSKTPTNELEIFNAFGQKIQTIYTNNASEIIISTDDLKSGIYFINIITNKNSSVHKLIKTE